MALPRSLRALLHGLIDYAGLFPPARLDMQAAVANYASYREGGRAWMLGRFVVPSSRLEEFEGAAAALLPKIRDAEPWGIALLGEDPVHDAEQIFAFNERHARSAAGRAVIDTLELKARTLEELDRLVRSAPPGVVVYVEVPLTEDPSDLLAALGNLEGRAKIRTGGITADAIPAVRDVARFVRIASDLGVPFKATAGLHHPLRGDFPLTYEPGSATGTMYGFLNIFAAALFADAGLELSGIEAVLTESDPSRLRFEERGVAWGGHHAALEDIERLRARVAISFGSCSFMEPADELDILGVTA
ncbi:MAG TPA: hypothetical protein VFT04_07175 [Gemmatimonadales bacterium]|nr:hypothetical protein [Gemmatimonadales bacterium]